MSPEALPYVTLLGVFYGSTLVASRFAVGQFAPTTYIGLRLVFASLGHVAIYTLSSRRPWPSDRQVWRHAPVIGIFATAIPMTAIVTSLQYQSSGVTAVLITINPAITVIMAHFFLQDEPLTKRKSMGILLAFAGAFILAISGESGLPDVERASPIGYLLVLVAMLSAGSATVYARRYMRELDAIDVASVRMWVAALVVFPLSLLTVGLDLSHVTVQGYAALFYASLVGTFAGMMLAFYNIQRFGATASALSAYVIPIVATIGGVLLLGETVTGIMLVGMVLIVGGIAIVNQQMRQPEQSSTSV